MRAQKYIKVDEFYDIEDVCEGEEIVGWRITLDNADQYDIKSGDYIYIPMDYKGFFTYANVKEITKQDDKLIIIADFLRLESDLSKLPPL